MSSLHFLALILFSFKNIANCATLPFSVKISKDGNNIQIENAEKDEEHIFVEFRVVDSEKSPWNDVPMSSLSNYHLKNFEETKTYEFRLVRISEDGKTKNVISDSHFVTAKEKEDGKMLFFMVIASVFLTFSNATNDQNFKNLGQESEKLEFNLTTIEQKNVGVEYRVANDSNSEWKYNPVSLIYMLADLKNSTVYELRLINKQTRAPIPDSNFLLDTSEDDFLDKDSIKSGQKSTLYWIIVGAFVSVIFFLLAFLFKTIFID
ncbi:unnamed protein product [Caenorhabditis angaria]|uniref:Fibronectin type-III domain-containing protein n=1 Tax=Caenorhabditis angaria TaxID=860376 RepID=A0A9P1J1X6_9PELO|nr:unnamed protein product [Caenorhabditis angaria]